MSGLDTEALNEAMNGHERMGHDVPNPIDIPQDCLRDIKRRYDTRVPPMFDPTMLAQAIRFVERTRADVQGEVFGGPEGRWYDDYAADIIFQYDLLTKEGKRA